MLSKILRDSYYAQYAVSLDESGRLNLTYNNEVFSIYNNNDQTLTVNFCSAIAYAIYSAGVKIKLDLSNLKEITAASSVLLFAEVNRWQLVYGGDIIVIVLPEPTECHIKHEYGVLGFDLGYSIESPHSIIFFLQLIALE